MQRRERLLAIGVGLLVGAWALDALAIEPGLAWLARVRADAKASAAEAAEAGALVDRSKQIMARWRAWHAAGVLDGEDAARFRAQQAVTGAARTSGCAIDTLGGGQRVAAAQGQAYDLLRLTVSGQGSLAEVQGFLAALESAPQPLRIERCEIAARDPRKDALDLSLTVSTRIASAAARSARTVPADTAAWAPEPRDGAADAAVREARPFSADRRPGRIPSSTTATGTAPTAAPGTWALVGVVTRDDGAIGFLRHLGSGEERIVRVGDTLEDQPITAIGPEGLSRGTADAASTMRIGTDLAGQPVGGAPAAASPRTAAAPAASASTPASSPAAAAAPGAAPSADREAILQRLRERRNRAPGNSP